MDPTEGNKNEEEIKSRNVKIMSVLGIMFSLGTLFIWMSMFVTYEMFFVKTLHPRYLESTTFDSEDGTCTEKYNPAYPLLRFNLTNKDDLYGVFEKIGDYGTVFDDILNCDCGNDINDKSKYDSLATSMDEEEDDYIFRACHYLCQYKNSKHEDLTGLAVEAFEPTNIKNKFIGLRVEDDNRAFEDYFFEEVCMERFEEWSDYLGRRCDKCAKEFFAYKDGLESVRGTSEKDCIKKNRTLVSSERLRPRQYRKCNTCSRDTNTKNDPCYSHALCNYITKGKASISVVRGANVYCVKAGCTKEDDEGVTSLLGGGREYEFSRYNYAMYFVTFCFGLIYSIVTSVFFIIRIVNGPSICGHDEFDKRKIAKSKMGDDMNVTDEELTIYREEKRRKMAEYRRRKNIDKSEEKDEVGYSSYVTCCAAFFIYGHVLQGIVYVTLVSVCTFGVVAPLTKPMQRVVNNVVNETYYGTINPLLTSEVGFWYDLNGWSIALTVFSYGTFILDIVSGIYLFFCFKDNKVNMYQALMKRFINKRSNKWIQKIIYQKVKDLDKTDQIMRYIEGEDIPMKDNTMMEERPLQFPSLINKVIDNNNKQVTEEPSVEEEEKQEEEPDDQTDQTKQNLRNRSLLRF